MITNYPDKIFSISEYLHTLRKPVLIILCFFHICCGAGSCFAAEYDSDIEINSSPNPVGSGARALAMGGAFIGIADDATAASWNPGGLFKLNRPEISFVGDFIHRIEDNSPEWYGIQTVSNKNINYFSMAYPFNFLNRNMIFSLSYQHLYDFNREWNFSHAWTEPRESPNGTVGDYHQHKTVDYQQLGNLSAVGISYCIQITSQFSIGMTLNIWNDWVSKNKWEQKKQEAVISRYLGDEWKFESYRYDRFSLKGYNVNMGVMWRNFNDTLSIGAVFKSPFNARLTYEMSYSQTHSVSESTFSDSDHIKEDEHLNMPMSYGLGLSYRFSDQFSAALDIYRTEWDDYVRTDYQGREISAITGFPASESDVRPTHQLRTGFEYRIRRPEYEIPLCWGFFYDPGPARGNPDDYYGFSIGSGFKIKDSVFYIAYQYRFGNDVGSAILEDRDFSQDLHEHTIYSSIVFHF